MCGRYVMARATSDLVALGDAEANEDLVPVSYTHLTLPTKA